MPNQGDVITLLSRGEICKRLGISVWTLNRWIARRAFPQPVYLQPGSPARWRVRDIEAYIDRRQRARRVKPEPRGMLKQFGGARR